MKRYTVTINGKTHEFDSEREYRAFLEQHDINLSDIGTLIEGAGGRQERTVQSWSVTVNGETREFDSEKEYRAFLKKRGISLPETKLPGPSAFGNEERLVELEFESVAEDEDIETGPGSIAFEGAPRPRSDKEAFFHEAEDLEQDSRALKRKADACVSLIRNAGRMAASEIGSYSKTSGQELLLLLRMIANSKNIKSRKKYVLFGEAIFEWKE